MYIIYVSNKYHVHWTHRLNILDANDNSPRFLSDLYYEAYINETASITTTVLQVMARDDDIDNNGRVSVVLVHMALGHWDIVQLITCTCYIYTYYILHIYIYTY